MFTVKYNILMLCRIDKLFKTMLYFRYFSLAQ